MDIAKGGATEKELDQLIARRSRQKDPDEEHALWLVSERLHIARREAEDRAARLAFHEGQAGPPACATPSAPSWPNTRPPRRS